MFIFDLSNLNVRQFSSSFTRLQTWIKRPWNWLSQFWILCLLFCDFNCHNFAEALRSCHGIYLFYLLWHFLVSEGTSKLVQESQEKYEKWSKNYLENSQKITNNQRAFIFLFLWIFPRNKWKAVTFTNCFGKHTANSCRTFCTSLLIFAPWEFEEISN